MCGHSGPGNLLRENYWPYKHFTDTEQAIAALRATHEADCVEARHTGILPDGTLDYELTPYIPASESGPH